ncbi:MAG: ATP-binding cassette domain-containing protein, partial [Clostridiales Family XIII bacterium]|nr:ATP-binding cassette domain-containing protein [Clostridiales Family XIII bacterium]
MRGLTQTFNKGLAYETTAVDDVSFDIDGGEFVAIVGHTGSGKTTLVQHLNGLLRPTSGTITLAGVDISAKTPEAMDMRKRIGMVFQYPEYQLFEETNYKDVAFGPKNMGLDERETDLRVREAFSLLGLDFAELSGKSPYELSGGQKRMMAMAGVVAMKPDIFILDEPTAGLDPKAHDSVLEIVRSLRERTGSTVIIISHNMDDVARFAGRIMVMSDGKLIADGTPAEVFADVAMIE